MGNKINCLLTPKFVKPFMKRKKSWKPKDFYSGFYKEFQSDQIKNLVKGIDLPGEIKKILARLDDISSENDSLLIDVPVNNALLFSILSHKNSELIKRIVFADLTKFPIDNVKEKYANNIESFESLFKVKIPDEIFELYGLYESFRSIVDNEVLDPYYGWLGINVWLRGFESMGGIFQSVFSDSNEVEVRDMLSMRHGHHDLTYFPVFWYGSDGVSFGFVFDPQLNEFTTCAYYGDGSYSGKEGLWPNFLESIPDTGYITGSLYMNLEDEDCDLLEEGKLTLTYQDLNRCLKNASDLWGWLLHFFVVEYLKTNEIKNLTFSSPNKVRYFFNWDYARGKHRKALTENGAYFISDTYPRVVLSIKDNFHPHLDGQIIKELLSIFELIGGRGDLKTFLENNPSVLGILPLDKFFNGKQVKEITDDSWNEFYKIMVEFAEKEASEKRYGLALLMGFLIWTRTEEETSEYAISLLNGLPDEVCHPLIKNLARVHGKTRFDWGIHF